MRPAAGVVWALALAALSLLAGAPAAQDEPPQMLYGSACGQFLPPPTLHFTGSIVPGEYGAIHVAGAPPGGFVILHIGTSNTTSSFGPLPFNLNGIAGIPSGCQLLTSGNYRIILNAKPDGTLKMGFKIPSTLGSDRPRALVPGFRLLPLRRPPSPTARPLRHSLRSIGPGDGGSWPPSSSRS